MGIKQLRYFLGVVRAKSITKAAGQLRVAQPALGLQIRNLEDELGVPLLVRHSRGVTPTDAGRLLAEHAEALLRRLDRTKQELLDFAGEPRGQVTIGMTTTTSLVLASVLAEKCRQRYPGIRLRITEGLSERLMEWVGSDRIDMTLTYNPDGNGNGALLCQPLLSESLFFVRARTTPRRRRSPISFARTLEGELILPSPPHLVRVLVEEQARLAGYETKVSFEVDSVPTIKELVRRGLGSTILPYGAVKQEDEAGIFEALPIAAPRLTRTLYLASSSQHPASNALNAVSEIIVDATTHLARDGLPGWEPVEPPIRATSGT